MDTTTDKFEKISTRIVSSLEKCFSDDKINDKPKLRELSALIGERVSFQLAIFPTREDAKRISFHVKAETDSGVQVEIRLVAAVPVRNPSNVDDGKYLRTKPGMYPDILMPVINGQFTAPCSELTALWFTLETDNLSAGMHSVTVELSSSRGTVVNEIFSLEIIPAQIPPQKTIFTQWFHTDCLAEYYGVGVFSERYWKLVKSFLETAVRNGMNMVLTPVFTPPLDTAPGHERPTVQLAEVTVNDGKYSFGFERLGRFIDMAHDCGIKYFEISHLFTQWGAAHAPKVMARVLSKCGRYYEKRIFGWETAASEGEYPKFLRRFLPELIAYLKAKGVDRNCYFHVSDEPNIVHLEQYKASKAVVDDILEGNGYPIIDALSNVEFYKNGAVSHPIPSNNNIEPFLKAGVPDLWTYYCCAQGTDVSNRFIAMPSARNRIIGVQMYKYNIKGFLHWGYNFYNSDNSLYPINPYLVNDGDLAFPAGDAFSVYPSPRGGAVESLRLAVFHEALCDIRALELCEKLYGRSYTLKLIDSGLEHEITFKEYPIDSGYLLDLRSRVNEAIKKKAGK